MKNPVVDGVTVCPGSSDPFYTVRYYIKWVITSLTHSIMLIGFNAKSDSTHDQWSMVRFDKLITSFEL